MGETLLGDSFGGPEAVMLCESSRLAAFIGRRGPLPVSAIVVFAEDAAAPIGCAAANGFLALPGDPDAAVRGAPERRSSVPHLGVGQPLHPSIRAAHVDVIVPAALLVP